MERKLLLQPEAEQDIDNGCDWYNGERDGLGDEFLTSVNHLLIEIRETPELYAAGYKSVRQVQLDRFPYIVYYRMINNDVEVIAVQHSSRHPRRWRSRI